MLVSSVLSECIICPILLDVLSPARRSSDPTRIKEEPEEEVESLTPSPAFEFINKDVVPSKDMGLVLLELIE